MRGLLRSGRVIRPDLGGHVQWRMEVVGWRRDDVIHPKCIDLEIGGTYDGLALQK
jgi:hypothetical protein